MRTKFLWFRVVERTITTSSKESQKKEKGRKGGRKVGSGVKVVI